MGIEIIDDRINDLRNEVLVARMRTNDVILHKHLREISLSLFDLFIEIKNYRRQELSFLSCKLEKAIEDNKGLIWVVNKKLCVRERNKCKDGICSLVREVLYHD